jgi:NCS1 family nucleobase:cation symporter-1
MIADYYVIKRTELDVDDLYRSQGRYRYGSGFNWRALTAMVLGILPCIPGFLEQALGPARVDVPVWLSQIYTYAWFVSFAIAFLSHLVLSNLFPPAAQGESRHP